MKIASRILFRPCAILKMLLLDLSLDPKPYLTINEVLSSNTEPTLAKAGDTVTLRFASSETLREDPTCTFTSGGAVVTGTTTVSATTNDYTCIYTVAAGDTDGAVGFTITDIVAAASPFRESARAYTVADTDVVVTVDKTAPTLTLVELVSDTNALDPSQSHS